MSFMSKKVPIISIIDKVEESILVRSLMKRFLDAEVVGQFEEYDELYRSTGPE
jgi:hypothetical protein